MKETDEYKVKEALYGITPAINEYIEFVISTVNSIGVAGQINSIEIADLDNNELLSDSIEEMNSLTNLINDSVKRITDIGVNPNSIIELNTVSDVISSYTDQLYVLNQLDLDSLSSQISSLLSNIDVTSIYEGYDRLADLKDIETNLNQILNRYQWFVLPEMPMSFVYYLMDLSKEENPRKQMNQLFWEYYSYNEFENLRNLVERWQFSQKFRPGRIKIINDCLYIMLNSKNGKIPSNVIVPTLIAQIDGIQRELLIKNNFQISKNWFKNRDTGKTMNKKDAWDSIYSPDDIFSSTVNDIILDVLFAKAYPGEPVKTPITFSRHKILHGEHLNYGTKFNVIRSFLIIDFLHDLL